MSSSIGLKFQNNFRMIFLAMNAQRILVSAQEAVMRASHGASRFFIPLAVSTIMSLLLWECRQSDDQQAQRQRMVETQIVARGVHDPTVLAAMRKVPRHEFVPEPLRPAAYDDRPLPIGEDQTISQPYIVALMTEVLDLSPRDKVLEIGTGSGYQAAVLAEIVGQVFTIEIIEVLGHRAETTLKRLGYDRVRVRIGDGYLGWEEHAPYDAIIVTCAPDHIPQPLTDQLAEGGRMVIPVGHQVSQELVLVEKVNGEIHRRSIIPVLFVPMTGEHNLP
jgi:protein-L-isoaspartate(D-aspartate) O-methyltransferase